MRIKRLVRSFLFVGTNAPPRGVPLQSDRTAAPPMARLERFSLVLRGHGAIERGTSSSPTPARGAPPQSPARFALCKALQHQTSAWPVPLHAPNNVPRRSECGSSSTRLQVLSAHELGRRALLEHCQKRRRGFTEGVASLMTRRDEGRRCETYYRCVLGSTRTATSALLYTPQPRRSVFSAGWQPEGE